MSETDPTLALAQDARSQLKAWLEEGMRWRGWRMPQLAKSSGVSRGTISRIINCKIDPGEDTMAKLAKALERPTPGTTGTLVIRAYEALNIMQDAVNRAQTIMDGDADPAVAAPRKWPPGEASGLPPDLYERHEDVAEKDVAGEDAQDPPT
ncbi:hypothetical protein LCGC14_1807450 [marine sediment metagenome]|uniref:HTH cro/C1-type domain-containing protein n=1 Tax=marine sediment metagenome TaxID=412755 RepID=A0A0F9GMX7_9ZZZZ